MFTSLLVRINFLRWGSQLADVAGRLVAPSTELPKANISVNIKEGYVNSKMNDPG
jgi:hypothetical protein